ncbi:MAG: hypothetical protein ABUS48_06050 [Pseudomonadota bacterium]
MDVAVARAHDGIAEVREAGVAAVDDKIAAILLMGADAPEATYRLSNEIFAEAGAFDLAEVSAAAFSLCCLLSSARGAGSPEAIRVHLNALRALRRADAPAGVILAGLSAIVARYADAPEPEPTERRL